MPVTYCDTCEKYIDLDTDVEHFEDHGEDQDEGFEFVEIGQEANEYELSSIESSMGF